MTESSSPLSSKTAFFIGIIAIHILLIGVTLLVESTLANAGAFKREQMVFFIIGCCFSGLAIVDLLACLFCLFKKKKAIGFAFLVGGLLIGLSGFALVVMASLDGY